MESGPQRLTHGQDDLPDVMLSSIVGGRRDVSDRHDLVDDWHNTAVAEHRPYIRYDIGADLGLLLSGPPTK